MSAQWLQVKNQSDVSELLITGQIGKDWWSDDGVSEKEFLNALSQFPADREVTIGINSQGGNVQDGLGIYNAIKRRGKCVARIDGYAVSIASIVALAADRVISPRGSIWMIHEPWAAAQGNAEDMRRAARMLDKHGDTLAQIYSEETGQPIDSAREAMKKETWFTGNEALDWGLADECTNQPAALDKLNTDFSRPPKDLLKIEHQVFALGFAPFNQISTPACAGVVGGDASTDGTKNTTQGDNPMTKLLTVLVEAKLIPSAKIEDTDAAEFVRAALKSAAETLADKDRQITALQETVTANRKAHAETIVAAAVADKRIKDDPTLRERWVSALLTDEAGATAMLSAIDPPKVVGGMTAEDVAKVEASKAKADGKSKDELKGRDRVAAAFQKQAHTLLGIKN